MIKVEYNGSNIIYEEFSNKWNVDGKSYESLRKAQEGVDKQNKINIKAKLKNVEACVVGSSQLDKITVTSATGDNSAYSSSKIEFWVQRNGAREKKSVGWIYKNENINEVVGYFQQLKEANDNIAKWKLENSYNADELAKELGYSENDIASMKDE